MTRQIVLASTSPYRRQLLARLQLPFDVHEPAFTEAVPGSMPPAALIRHNTLCKAASVAERFPEAIIIAADQIAICGKTVLGKPGNHDAACRQLRMLAGRAVDFLTGLAVLEKGREYYEADITRVHFRKLSEHEIATYVSMEKPFGCAGSFKAEGLGICLFESIESCDPTALIGLPLIRLCRLIRPLERLGEN